MASRLLTEQGARMVLALRHFAILICPIELSFAYRSIFVCAQYIGTSGQEAGP